MKIFKIWVWVWVGLFCSNLVYAQSGPSPDGHDFNVYVYGPERFSNKDELAWWDQKCPCSAIVHGPEDIYSFEFSVTNGGEVQSVVEQNNPPFVHGKIDVPDSTNGQTFTLKVEANNSSGQTKDDEIDIPWVDSPAAELESDESAIEKEPRKFGPRFQFTPNFTSANPTYSCEHRWNVGGTLSATIPINVAEEKIAELGVEFSVEREWGYGESIPLNVHGNPGDIIQVLVYPVVDVKSGPIIKYSHCGAIESNDGSWKMELNERLTYTTVSE